jgi:putative ABC transport system permease protein
MKYLYFVWKSLGRKKVRTTLTILSILVAFILYGMLGSLKLVFTGGGADAGGDDRLVVIHKITLIMTLPESYIGRVAALEGVKQVTQVSWFGGYYQEPRNQFVQFPVDAETYFKVYPEFVLPEEQARAWKQNRIGAVIGEDLAKRFGWKVGDRIPVTSQIYPHDNGNMTWDFVIEGIFTSTKRQMPPGHLLFHYAYFDEAKDWAKGEIGWMVLTIDDPARAAVIARQIDEMFANSPAETRTSTEQAFGKSFLRMLGNIGLIVSLVLTAVFFTMLLVSGNTMAQSVRERIPELAVLKTIGFGDITILALVLAEALLIALIGALFGMAIAWVAVKIVAMQFGDFLSGMSLTQAVFAQGLGFAVLFGILAGLLPAVQAMRLSIANALGRH